MSCEHDFRHLDTIYKTKHISYTYSNTYTRLDRFYCSRCLEIKEVVKEEDLRSEPDWFDKERV